MLTVEEMITKKREYGFSYEYIAEKSGVPVSTVQKIFSKKTPTPRRVTLAALSKAFYTGSSDSSFDERSFSSYSGCNFVCDSDYELEAGGYIKNRVAETSGEYGAFDGTGALHAAQDNSKTIDDYIKLPEGTRVELIDRKSVV